MTTADTQEKLKEEAKAIQSKLETLIKEEDIKLRIARTICVYAGMITETLLEYEEPDVLMEQALHRIADLLRAEPSAEEDDKGLMPLAYDVDHDTGLGRHLARGAANRFGISASTVASLFLSAHARAERVHRAMLARGATGGWQ
mgnify:CR=1 FL=1